MNYSGFKRSFTVHPHFLSGTNIQLVVALNNHNKSPVFQNNVSFEVLKSSFSNFFDFEIV